MRTRKRCYSSSSSSSSSSSTAPGPGPQLTDHPFLRIRVPRHLGRNGSPSCGTSSWSSTANGSPSTCSSTARSAPTDPNVIMRGVLGAQLRGHGLSANELTLFARYFEENRLESHVFMNIEGDKERISFLRELDLTPYKPNPNQ